jgi:glycosyltransferase involved in cell wall biosynthesis
VKVAVSIVGKRTEHWEGFFVAIAQRPAVELVVHAADITPLARARFELLALEHANFRFELAGHLLGEDLTGHMASILLRPGSWSRSRAFRPDVLHIIGEPAYLATYQAIRFRNRHWPAAPITHYAAQNVVTRFPYPFPWLERHAYRQIACAFPVTPAALAVLRAKGYRGEAQIVPLGVDHERFRPRSSTPQGPFTVGFVGRLEPHKGIADLVAATERAGCRLLAVGDGSLRPWLEARAAERPGEIELLPWLSHEQLPAALARMHVLALASVEVVQRNVLPWIRIPLREQFGRVLLEAMAVGVPVVASRVGEIPHVLGSAGIVVAPGDADELAAMLTRLRDPRLAEQLAQAGVARAARFHWSRVADEVHESWLRLTGSRRNSGRDSGEQKPSTPRTLGGRSGGATGPTEDDGERGFAAVRSRRDLRPESLRHSTCAFGDRSAE